MNEMISNCGILCHECGAYIATKADDDAKRKEVAELWSTEYGADVKPEDINCDGCLSDGERLFSHCTVCDIRKCCRERALVNCAYCDEYACDKLENIFRMVPDAKERLDIIRGGS